MKARQIGFGDSEFALNSISTEQLGDANTANFYQAGMIFGAEMHQIDALQSGEGNMLAISQVGNGESYGNMADTMQEGDYNSILIDQQGLGNTTTMTQMGNGNTAVVTQGN